MSYSERIPPLKFFFYFLLVPLIQVSCNKDDDNDDEVNYHTGWHESMPGMILFTSEKDDGAGTITYDHLYTIDSSNEKRLIEPPDSIYHIQGMEWSPDGSKIAIIDGNFGLYIMDNDGTNAINIYNNGLQCSGPSWSPDGTSIAFIENFKKILLIDPQNGESNILYLKNGLSVWYMDWSPTMGLIAFDNSNTLPLHDQEHKLNMLTVADSTCVELKDSHANFLAWSPDGTKIAYTVNDDKIYTINADGSNITQVVNPKAYSFDIYSLDLVWSPDGTMIAVGGYKGIYVFDLDGVLVTIIPVAYCDNLDWR